MNNPDVISKTFLEFPALLLYLKKPARGIVLEACKTYDYMLQVVTRLVRSVHAGLLGGEFVDIMATLMQGQITQAFEQAWIDDGNPLPITGSMAAKASELVTKYKSFDFIYQYYKDIVDSRVDGTPIAPLLERAKMWAARYNEAYNEAKAMIALEMGGKLKWVYGDADHCETCENLNGIVAYAKVWSDLDVHPQGAPNNHLQCGGWRCQCQLIPTNERQSRDAEKQIRIAVERGSK